MSSVKLRRTTRQASTAAAKKIQNAINEEQATDYTVNSHYLVDRKVSKKWDVAGNVIVYTGRVDYYKDPWFRVKYDDGDCEDVSLAELLKIVID